MSILAASASSDVLAQSVQIVGALCVLGGFASLQFGLVTAESRTYLIANLVGSTTLAVLAALDRQYGFLLLEAVWAVVSAWALVKNASARGHAA